MKIGIIKEGKNPPDQRVPLSPEQCKFINDNFENVEVKVQSSSIRKYRDEDYSSLGVVVSDNVDDCDVLMGVKEVPIEMLIPEKTYFFFSHTIKEQPYNRNLLRSIMDKRIKLVDYETLTEKKGYRLIGFGRYAGIVGAYNTFYAYGMRTGEFMLKRAYQCEDRREMEKELGKVKLPSNYKIVLTGGGRVASGAMEILDLMGISKVTPKEYLTKEYDEPVYAQLSIRDYINKDGGKKFNNNEFYEDPTDFESDFLKYSKVSDIYIACHYWDPRSPFIFTKEEAKAEDFKIKVVGDISCDVDGPVPCTVRSSTIEDPIYGYDPIREKELEYNDLNGITVMAVDNLPCELPKDASSDFGSEFTKNILPSLLGKDGGDIIRRATITENGSLTKDFQYLQDYIEGK